MVIYHDIMEIGALGHVVVRVIRHVMVLMYDNII